MLQQLSEQQADALARAADADDRAKELADPTLTSEYERLAHSWRVLARSYEFQHALERFMSFQKSRAMTKGTSASNPQSLPPPVQACSGNEEVDFLDKLANKIEDIRPFSLTALGIAVSAVAIATILRWFSGSTVIDPRFSVYVAAIMATGLIAGVPAAVGAAAASIFIVLFAFLPPYFTLKWPAFIDQISLLMAAIASLITILFSHCCRIILRQLHTRGIANQLLANELAHRGRNMFHINQMIVLKSLADAPERAETIIGRFGAIQSANEFLTATTARPVTLRELLSIEFAPHGERRLVAVGPQVVIAPESVRHLLLLFHELVTNAAKYGALSASEGRIKVEWKWSGGRRVAINWNESGGPEVLNPTKNGFGNQLMIACAKSLDGSIEKSFSRYGFSCKIVARIR